ncbi:FG-GAP repeat domain-containing protein [Albidovulum sediminicola]|uniref:VCBS repeat-containing protein n=1 Tax=Albidovulum sediminicola TaxID=2984331 RepID=A0ABT2Z2T5_9RHOB|nr:VCBS repeat-containing protein [Defluviimonas sp. WL0075]MCV2865421.1 VCBS repeat-containing protein [Defluviimonas sp. WL0075]
MRAAAFALVLAGAAAAASAEIVEASYEAPTARYDHGALGDKIEWGALELRTTGERLRVTLPETRVFEDTAPRLADLDGDGAPEVIVVETDLARGARLSVYGEAGLIAATPFIGRTHRWLAPAGIADLDGDGQAEIAYVETPHLAMVLKIVRLEDGKLVPVAAARGLTNHRNGDAFIQGGAFRCGGRWVVVTADAGWSRVMATQLTDGRLVSRPLGPYLGPESLDRPKGCN